MTDPKVFTVGSLFAGIGGIELGLEMTGRFKTVWQVESSEYCRKVLARHWPDAIRYEDVRDVGIRNLAPVDVICGGYPCQPFSTAGLRRGKTDERHLWPEFARIVGELRPAYAILENVPNHLSLGFGDVLGDLADLGYDAEWTLLSACSLGAAHSRERLFVLAYPAGFGRPEVVSRQAGFSDAAGGRWPARNAHSRLSPTERLSEYERVCGQPALLGTGHGLPRLMDSLRALGNSVSPVVARVIGEWLLEIDAELNAESAA